jgi:hypothetical protein
MRSSKSIRTKYAGHRSGSDTAPKSDNPKGDEQRRGEEETYFVDKDNVNALRDSESDLAIVCPLVDGRLRDVAAKD